MTSPFRRRRRRLSAAAGVLLLAAVALAGCSGDDGPTLTVYNAQHEELLEELVPIFEEDTGIDVELRNGSDFELANQIVQEGEDSPADVFLTENSPAMSLVENEGLFARLPRDVGSVVPAAYRPSSGLWTGFAARSTVLVYNTGQVAEADLPASLMDLADPEWRGRVSFSPTGADFQAIVSAVLELEGRAATQRWLAGLQANGTTYQGNNVVLESVNAGQVATGIIYHYYWYRDQEESGANSDSSRLHFFTDQDPGAFVSVSGAGVLASSENASEAEQFVGFLVGEEGQRALADSYALEYPLNPAVDLGRGVKPFSELQPPRVDVSGLNGPEVIELMQEEGFI